jgi:hypothetical protein
MAVMADRGKRNKDGIFLGSVAAIAFKAII